MEKRKLRRRVEVLLARLEEKKSENEHLAGQCQTLKEQWTHIQGQCQTQTDEVQ
jgi:hypothetical protein